MELTTHTLQHAPPGTVLRDKNIPGLQARIGAQGKRFYLYFRTKSGVERRPKLGDFPVMSLAAARALAKDWLLEVAKGHDPSGERQAARAASTVRDLIDEYEAKHAPKRKRGHEVVHQLRKYVQPMLGAEKAVEVTSAQVESLHTRMMPTPVLANRVVANLSKLFNLAAKWEKWPDSHHNPAHGIERYPERKRQRYMSGAEAPAIAAELDAAAADHPASVAFLYLLILTGARKSEIAGAQWGWVKGSTLHLPDSKTGEKPVYLPPAAMAVLDRLPRTSGTLTGIADPKKLWGGVRRRAGCPDLRMHDLRHSFASAAVSAGLSLTQIGELLGHASPQTTMRYAHLIDEAAHNAVARTADVVEGRMHVQAQETA